MRALEQILNERSRQSSEFRAEADRLRQKAQAPLIELLKKDERVARGVRQLRRLAERARTGRRLVPPPIPKLAPGIASGSLSTVSTPPYFMAFGMGNGTGDRSASQDGHFSFNIRGDGHGSWAWVGVAIPFRPLFPWVRIAPFASYSYGWAALGTVFSAHTEGYVGVHIHRYDGNWKDPDPAHPDIRSSLASLWNYTAGANAQDDGTGLFSSRSEATPVFPMDTNSNYLVWAICQGACDDSGTQVFGFSVGTAAISVNASWILVEQSDRPFP